ncbi:MAG: sulfotransferase, partial [Burkholderiales bacterium]
SVLSCFMQNFKVNRAMASFWTIGDTARTYDAAFSFWETCRSLMPLAVHELRYEDMIADMAGTISPLTQFLGLDWHPEMLDFQKTARERRMIRTPSYAQVTEQLYTRARGRWERYRDQMDADLPVLDRWVSHFGYSPVLPAPGT